MRTGRPSLTAAFVAFGRGVGIDERHRDPLARELSPPPFAQALGLLERTRSGRTATRAFARIASAGLVDHATLRMAAVDDEVRRAFEGGVEQLVILGAGLDTRAYRMEALSGVDVYEVDHPATQAYKRSQVDWRPIRARSLHFVPVDFERQRLGETLADAGHDADRSTLWLWEAVTMYLNPAAIDSTFGELSTRSAEGSRLLVTYITPNLLPLGESVNAVARAAFRLMGEPLLGMMESGELTDRLRGVRFRLVSDTGSDEWARRFGGSALLSAPFRTERLAVAHRFDGGP